ncbi:hypothetical protein ECH_0995 [Ehrlichia chaffeensis str. Arkansas]|uniref:Uncharacterized protein n=1 Tax=Ehrlichia chaffeensis (strain ATCC CRL-10679 / Arkansas) TaxID=205920 RepID=Q2GFK1_EHRCR|nr:hypothetical protein ECH_0995 [Ehrlichia chaffeensis str. Arkansas]
MDKHILNVINTVLEKLISNGKLSTPSIYLVNLVYMATHLLN